jgi:hypothetical protein
MIENFADLVDPGLKRRSGKVFYSGRLAFGRPNDVYLLGINPGGNPTAQADETIGSSIDRVLTQHPDRWSAYRDESWQNKKPGTYGMQPRVLHILRRLGRDPQETPAGNLIFVRSSRKTICAGTKSNSPSSAGSFTKPSSPSCGPASSSASDKPPPRRVVALKG